jgi:hypothetical protein
VHPPERDQRIAELVNILSKGKSKEVYFIAMRFFDLQDTGSIPYEASTRTEQS